MHRLILVWVLMLLLSAAAAAQWPALCNSNRRVAGRANEQTLPKIAATPNGGLVIVWQDRASGNFDTYLQRVNADGVLQWAVGVPVSAFPQDTWLTGYDLQVDPSGNVLIALSDIRSGTDRDIYAYRLNAAGQFSWGANGAVVSANANLEADPRLAVTAGGNSVIVWTENCDTTEVINLRKLGTGGQDLWDPPTRTLTDSITLSTPRIVASDSDRVIVLYLRHTGTEPASPRHLVLQKFGASVQPLWGKGGVVVFDTSGIGPQMSPELLSDSAGGAFACWQVTADGVTPRVYAQHVLADGSIAWTARGVALSQAAQESQGSPAAVRVPGSSELIVGYVTSDLAQTSWGIGGQKLNAAGEPQWGVDGLTLVPLGAAPCSSLTAQPVDSGAVLVYFQCDASSPIRTLHALRVSAAGTLVWGNAPRLLSGVASAKSALATTVNTAGQVVAVWDDRRAGVSGDVYLQNVNPAGTLGPIVPVPPVITITEPAESTAVALLPLSVEFAFQHFQLAGIGGDGVVAVTVNGGPAFWHTTFSAVVVPELTPGVNEIVLSFVDYAFQPLVPPVADTLHVLYEPSAAGELPALPTELRLTAYPNPFNARTEFTYTLAQPCAVRLTVLNTLGQRVAMLVDAPQSAGVHRVNFDGGDLATGLYVARLETGSGVYAQKLVLLK